jgi:hypothetical protein
MKLASVREKHVRPKDDIRQWVAGVMAIAAALLTNVLVAKVLDGSKAADLPVERPEKFRLVVNLKTAKAIGITIPQSILVNADEVIR